MRWALDKGINIALWGARNPGQMEGIETIWGWKLKESDFIEIDQILQRDNPLPYRTRIYGPSQSRQNWVGPMIRLILFPA